MNLIFFASALLFSCVLASVAHNPATLQLNQQGYFEMPGLNE